MKETRYILDRSPITMRRSPVDSERSRASTDNAVQVNSCWHSEVVARDMHYSNSGRPDISDIPETGPIVVSF